MPMQSIPIGMAVTVLANTVYALPAVEVVMFTDAAAPTVTQSNTSNFAANAAVTVTAGVATLYGGFVKFAADTLVILKRD